VEWLEPLRGESVILVLSNWLTSMNNFEDNYTGESYEKTSLTHMLFRKKISYWSWKESWIAIMTSYLWIRNGASYMGYNTSNSNEFKNIDTIWFPVLRVSHLTMPWKVILRILIIIYYFHSFPWKMIEWMESELQQSTAAPFTFSLSWCHWLIYIEVESEEVY